jgi:dipeptidase
MQNLESQLHTLLEDIAPDVHSHEEQAKIIAVASANISKKFTARRFAKADGRVLESQMTDAILIAMSTLSSWDNEDDEIFDARGLFHAQLIKRVANTTKPSWGQMDILNPDVIEDTFSFEEEDEPDSETKLENAQQTTEAFDTPGRGRHRSDFISAPIR